MNEKTTVELRDYAGELQKFRDSEVDGVHLAEIEAENMKIDKMVQDHMKRLVEQNERFERDIHNQILNVQARMKSIYEKQPRRENSDLRR